MKPSTKKALTKYWPIYVAAAIAMPVLSYVIVEQIQKPKNEETISIFVGSCNADARYLKEKLNSNKPSYLLEINLYSYSYVDSTFSTYYQANGKMDVDLVILPESKIDDASLITYYSPLDESHFSTNDYLSKDSKTHFGILVREKGEANSLLTFSDDSHDENYYAFFGKSSKHGGSITNSQYDTSLIFISLIKEGRS